MIIKKNLNKYREKPFIEINGNINYNFFENINLNQNLNEYNNFIKKYDIKYNEADKEYININSSDKKYTILQYNFNDYECFNEPLEVDPECEYIYVTDNPKLKSNIWKIIVDPSLNNYSDFDKCYQVRYNLFKYATTPVCIYMDASIMILKSCRKIYDTFINSNADIGLNIHPFRNNIIAEYNSWLERYKDTPQYIEIYREKQNVIKYMLDNLYDFNYKGLYQGTMRICKNTNLNKKIDSTVLQLQQLLGTNKKCARITQTIYSYVLNEFYNTINVFPFSSRMFLNSTLTKPINHRSTKIETNAHPFLYNNITPYLFNKEVQLANDNL